MNIWLLEFVCGDPSPRSCSGVSYDPFADQALTLDNVARQTCLLSSPGDGVNAQTANSFDLGKESNVTIKICNAAEHLVRGHQK